jgi:hypothetical protein
MDIVKLLAELVGLAGIIFAAVAYLKQWGIKGNWLTGSGFVVGLVIGLGYRYAVQPMIDFASWFWAVIFGLMAGFMATGAYKGAGDIAAKAQPPASDLTTTVHTSGFVQVQPPADK